MTPSITSAAVGAGIATTARLLCGCRARWHADPVTERPRLYFANHTSHLDSVMVWAALPPAQRRTLRIVAARGYWDKNPARRWLATRVFNALLVDRNKSTRSDNLTRALADTLSGGCSALLFPEGTRGCEALPCDFRPGLWHAARACPQAELVPVWIENLGRVLPKGEFLPVPVLAAVTFGQPIAFDPVEPRADFLARARAAICSLADPQAGEAAA